ncbi:hypothetical protein LXL04_001727 [Taraxacum kok-saghyz]
MICFLIRVESWIENYTRFMFRTLRNWSCLLYLTMIDLYLSELYNFSTQGVWKNIINIKTELEKNGCSPDEIFKHNIKSGETTLFWNDVWIGDTKLKHKYPNLFALEPEKNCTIAQKIKDRNTPWKWRSCPLAAGLSQQLCDLYSDFTALKLTTGADHWTCRLTTDGKYTVEALRKKIDQLPPTAPSVSWYKEIPIKVTCFTWRAALERIPTATSLSQRGVNIDSTLCSSCIGMAEDSNHILLHCPYATMIWEKIFKWCDTNIPSAPNIKEMLQVMAKWGWDSKKKKRLMIICYAMIWGLWKLRNDRIFRGSFISPSSGVDHIKSIAYTWIKYRGNDVICDWENWTVSPFSSCSW